MEKPVIRLVDYALAFPIFHGGARSLKKSLFKSVKQTVASRGRVGGQVRNVSDTMMVQALDGLTLEINAGERVGLIGHNGAGKSTLLRALAGIYESPFGKLEIRGEVHALLDPQSGMNIDLTGRENIELFARMLQFDQNQTKELEREVEDFADLGAFLDLPVRLYSSGMVVRLGFGLATAPRPQILLMDEWFMAGDQHFQDKARARLESMIAQADILVLTSHSLPVLREWSTRVIWMEGGRVRMDGAPDTVLDAYEAAS
ncbi:ABC transporter ATP-binding protein [Kozakia baliensis]|uniref:ABC transporter ATP-binding protein n=1 Tax=Kozakia baliensis TaxID=153496 RepID=UPI00055F61AE|nr:ATP-binding cassette domain-containing protein [Kozakia baliensis]